MIPPTEFTRFGLLGEALTKSIRSYRKNYVVVPSMAQ